MVYSLLNILFAKCSSFFGESAVPLVFDPLVITRRNSTRQPCRLMIVAHPDDETLFGGDALTALSNWLVVCVTNAGNRTRRHEFIRAMNCIGADYVMLNHADHLSSGNFHPALEQQLATLLAERPWEMVVTHAESGEYGHPQHKSLHRIVRKLAPPHRLHVFGVQWWRRGNLSAAKQRLLACYPSQDSVRRFHFLAARESLVPLAR